MGYHLVCAEGLSAIIATQTEIAEVLGGTDGKKDVRELSRAETIRESDYCEELEWPQAGEKVIFRSGKPACEIEGRAINSGENGKTSNHHIWTNALASNQESTFRLIRYISIHPTFLNL